MKSAIMVNVSLHKSCYRRLCLQGRQMHIGCEETANSGLLEYRHRYDQLEPAPARAAKNVLVNKVAVPKAETDGCAIKKLSIAIDLPAC